MGILSSLSLGSMAAKFPMVAANPVGALLFSKNFWKFILIAAIGLGVYFGMKHMYDSHMELKNQVVKEHQANVDLQNDLNEKKESLQLLADSIKNQQDAIDRLNRRQSQNADALDKLRQKFSDRDIGTDAKRDPVSVEKEVNQSEKDRARCYQLATGSQQREGEVNSVCPQLLRLPQSH